MKQVKIEELISSDGEIGTLPAKEQIFDAMEGANWSDDPGTGVAVLLPDGREVLNPTPMAPPLNYVQEESVTDRLHEMLVRERVRRELEEGITETEEESQDFDVEDEFDVQFVTPYEMVDMINEAPRLPGSPTGPVSEVTPEAAQAQLELDRAGGKDGTT